MILAGGLGSRLCILSEKRAKPAVPFGGKYRIIDFTLSNCLNSGLRRILVLTQYKAMSLDRHINQGWRHYFNRELGEFIDVVPPQQRIDEQWYQGTADAVYQNIYVLEKERPKYVVILAGDHIYKMNYKSMVQFHLDVGADVTVGALRVNPVEARQFGVMEIDTNQRIVGFEEKVPNPKTIPGDPQHCLGSMGIYVFAARFLFEQLCRDATKPGSRHDFGRDIIPSLIESRRVFAFPFRDENRKTDAYWRDVGTLDAYYEANMDLLEPLPAIDLYQGDWPIRTYEGQHPPARSVHGKSGREAEIVNCMLASGTLIVGGTLRHVILFPNVRVEEGASVEDSLLFEGVTIGEGAQLRRCIIDKHVAVPAGESIGFDRIRDAERFTVSDCGIVVIAKGYRFADEPGGR
jgi:glucose-1-phosphate adenylyltransferase